MTFAVIRDTTGSTRRQDGYVMDPTENTAPPPWSAS